MLNIDFPFILMFLLFFSGIIYFIDVCYWSKLRQQRAQAGEEVSVPTLVDYARSFFPIIVIVLIIRSFFFQFYRVPTGSLEPTVQPVEFLMVNQYKYGLFLPMWRNKILNVSEPKTGDIALFHPPVNYYTPYVKRVIGVPGDKISYIDKVLYINGKKQSQTYVGTSTDAANDGSGPRFPVKVMQENLEGHKHLIFINSRQPGMNFYNLKVPQGYYFMMGDNRDNSDDSRYWGVTPADSFMGKAERIVFSWDRIKHRVRWNRIGEKL